MQLTERRTPEKKEGRSSIISDPPDMSKGQRSTDIDRIMKFINLNGIKLWVLVILCLQNSVFTLLRRYSQGVLKEQYSKHEVLVVGEFIKVVFSAYMVSYSIPEGETFDKRIKHLIRKSDKMFVLAAIYGAMNILSYISLRNIGAGMFTIFAQIKILTTATFSAILLRRKYSWARWRALFGLSFGVLLFSQPIWSDVEKMKVQEGGSAFLGTAAVLIEVTLSGFASIYFEKVIKTDAEQLGIWERNFQLAFASCPLYFLFMAYESGGEVGFGGGWSIIAWSLAILGAAGGLLVALSIKYGDSILKTLATTGAIVISACLDHWFMGGPLNAIMMIAGVNVVIAICNYTFDTTPVVEEKALASSQDIEVIDVENADEKESLTKSNLS